MCGIVGAIDRENIAPILLAGLKRLAYRGYDSAGIAVLDKKTQQIARMREKGKLEKLETCLAKTPLKGPVGIAHTRWATHGKPSALNAHPMISCKTVAVVHNGIIENHAVFRKSLQDAGYVFTSSTDTEVVAHLLHHYLKTCTLKAAAAKLLVNLEGAFALAILYQKEPHHIIAIRKGPPLVVGLTEHGNFLASDHVALLPVTHRFMYLNDEEIADIYADSVSLYNTSLKPIQREIYTSNLGESVAERGDYPHFMLKEIMEQPHAVLSTLEGRVSKKRVLKAIFGHGTKEALARTACVQIAACGSSFHAALVGKYWIEALAQIPCQVEIASELRYRKTAVTPRTLFVTLSQSGETADTLAAMHQAAALGYLHTLSICNVPESSITRSAQFNFLTQAGIEIGVASTKGFITQLVALLLLTFVLSGNARDGDPPAQETVSHLHELPKKMQQVLALSQKIAALAPIFVVKQHAIFLGRGLLYPIALEGALKMMELSYIQTSAYAAGELKHGPLALVDENMPVVVLAPDNHLSQKLKSNIQEVLARGGDTLIFCNNPAHFRELVDKTRMITLPTVPDMLSPLLYTLPLQLLAYHVAVCKGTDVDQPRNLAKSVTVE